MSSNSPSPLNGWRDGVRGEAVRFASALLPASGDGDRASAALASAARPAGSLTSISSTVGIILCAATARRARARSEYQPAVPAAKLSPPIAFQALARAVREPSHPFLLTA